MPKIHLKVEKLLLIFVFSFVFSSCATQQVEKITLKKASFSNLKGWKKESYKKSFSAFKKSCEKMLAFHGDYKLPRPLNSTSQWKKVCNRALNLKGKNYTKFFEDNFSPYKVIDGIKTTGLFTGYYEPELQGSKKQSKKYKYPVYGLPDNLSKPYLGRRRIENGEIEGKVSILAYVDDSIELFFLHIQGSGRIKFDDGTVMRVGYAGQNGCPYLPIGRYLSDIGEMSINGMSAEKIKKWLRDNPKRAQEVMNKNQSYVFFRKLNVSSEDGPIGAQGVPLIPEVSLAVDNNLISYGLPIWLETSLPDGTSYNKLMIAQDTGGAIKGAVRGDIFFGFGKVAKNLASKMKQLGRYYILIPEY